MTTETSELTGDLILNQESKDDDEGDDDNVNGDNNHRKDVDSVSQDITTAAAAATATITEECESRVNEQNTKATEEAVFINHGE